MSRESRHALHAKKGTPSGSPSVSGASADKTNRTAGNLDAKPKNRRMAAILAVVFVVLLAVAGCGIFQMAQAGIQAEQVRTASETDIPEAPSESSMELAENPIDFAAEQAKAPDAYAWIYVPGTNINFPIVRHPADDNYYLDHTAEGEESFMGAIYTQSMNATDFTDPVTVIYGHNIPKYDVMFTEAHNFEDPAFFDANKDLYIYTPGHVLTYEVVAAYEYDNRHIMNSFDFTDEATLQGYFDGVTAPESEVANVREGTSLDASHDRIVQLSTCTNPSDPSKRYIVTGMLTSDDPTL